MNKNFGKDPTVFLKALANDAVSGFHPIGCDTIASVFDHEVAYILDYTLGLSNNNEMQALFKRYTRNEIMTGLSGYAINEGKIAEFIAEGWAEYCNNPKPRKLATEIANIILKGVKKR